MTGKELFLFLLGTGLAAGAGGVGAAIVLDGGADEDSADSEILARIDDLRAAIDDTQASLSENRTALRRMDRRVQQFENDLATTGAKLASGELAAAPVGDGEAGHQAAIRSLWGDDGALRTQLGMAAASEEAQKAMVESIAKMAEGIQIPTLTLGDGATDSLSAALGGLTKGLELRKLPEEERWQKARDELGLTDAQINEIRSAIDERDAAVGQALKIDRDADTGSARISVQSLDFTKAREANQAYRKRVDNTLNEQQKKDWREQGYDRAFGKSGLGMTSGTVISVSSFEESEDVDER